MNKCKNKRMTDWLTFLGFDLHSVQMTVVPTAAKIQKLFARCNLLLQKTTPTIRQVTGIPPITVLAFGGWQVHMALVAKKDDFSSTIRLSLPALRELQWWLENSTRSLSIRVQTTLNHIRFVVYHNIKDNERIFVKICWQLKIETACAALCKWATWTCQTFLSKPFANSPLTWRNNTKKMFGKEQWRVLLVDKSTDHDKPHYDLFLPQYQRQRKCFFFSERELKKALGETLTREAWYGLLSTTAN